MGHWNGCDDPAQPLRDIELTMEMLKAAGVPPGCALPGVLQLSAASCMDLGKAAQISERWIELMRRAASSERMSKRAWRRARGKARSR